MKIYEANKMLQEKKKKSWHVLFQLCWMIRGGFPEMLILLIPICEICNCVLSLL